ncbi:MAG: hypothetical protein J5I98_31670 [Phaeodactylibacter sp.]|nr:hypothetical protein [Phaeodactylibacter sp.]
MSTNYSMEDIIAFLEKQRNEEDTRQFRQAADSDGRLQAETEACCLLIRAGRKSRFRKFLKEVEDFDEALSGSGPG